MQHPAGKTGHGCAGVAEQHAPGAVAIEYLFYQFLCRGVGVQPGGQIGGAFARFQGIRHFTPAPVLLFLGLENCQVVEAGRVQQSQPCKMTRLADLLRRGSEQ